VTRRIDAHHHLWDLAVRDQPWMTPPMAPIARSFTLDEFAANAATNGVAASIVVQTVTEIDETEELLDLASDHEILAGVIGSVDVGAHDVGAQLDRLLSRSSSSFLVGVRSLVQYEPDPEWLARPAVLAGLRAVGERGLVNELLVLPHQLGAASRAVAQVPDSRFVVDHLAKPPIASRDWQPWAVDMADIASHDRVSVKISGLVTEADWSAWTIDDVKPYVDRALEIFGPGRVMFGSDWPVCTLAASYTEIVALADRLVSELSSAERAAVLGGNAADVYSLGVTQQEAS
jgi:L-fuconolactonase